MNKDGFRWREMDSRKTGDNDVLQEDGAKYVYPFL